AFRDEAQAIREANAVPFGLGAAVWTKDVRAAHRVAQGIRAGIVWVNDYHPIDPASPWGGFKMSGSGRENGLEAIRQYTEVKSIWGNLDDRPIQWDEPSPGPPRLNWLAPRRLSPSRRRCRLRGFPFDERKESRTTAARKDLSRGRPCQKPTQCKARNRRRRRCGQDAS